MTKSERRRYIKSFTAVWIMICVLLLTVWCIVNCVLDVRLYGSFAIKSYIFLFIVLGVIILITVLTVFGLWGVFMRKVSKSYRPHEIESRQRMEELHSEFQAIDAHKSRENRQKRAFCLFDDKIKIGYLSCVLHKKYYRKDTRRMFASAHGCLFAEKIFGRCIRGN